MLPNRPEYLKLENTSDFETKILLNPGFTLLHVYKHDDKQHPLRNELLNFFDYLMSYFEIKTDTEDKI